MMYQSKCNSFFCLCWIRHLAAIAFAAAVLAAPANALAQNLLTNPGFESDFAGWTHDWGNSFIETSSVHSGAKSIRVGPSAGGRAQRLSGLSSGTQYTMCAWSKADSLSTTAHVGVDIYDAGSNLLANHQWSIAWTNYEQRSVTFVLPTPTDFTNVWIWSDGGDPVYADDFILVEGPSCTSSGNYAPTASFTTSVADLNADFTDTSIDSDGTIVEWSWGFGDGNTSTAQDPSHNYAAADTYTVNLTVTDDEGATGTITKNVAVGSAITPNVIMSWVAPYAIPNSQAMADAELGACDPVDGLSRVGLQFWTPNTNGSIKYADHEWYTPTDADVAWWTNWGQANGIEILLTIYNNDGSWNWPLARSAFADNRGTFVDSLVAEMERLNLDGIDIDLEGIGSLDSDRSSFSLFIQDLSAELQQRGKILVVDSFPYIWNAPNVNWWPDWVGYVDNIQSMGYELTYEGGTGWEKYSWQQSTGVAAGHDAKTILMGMPAWNEEHSNWGVSSGRGTSAQAHVQEVRYDLAESSGIAIWDMQLLGWQNSDLWCEIRGLRGTGDSNNSPTASFSYGTTDLGASFTDTSSDGDGTIVSWSWDFGDGNMSTAQNPSHNYTAGGTYRVTLTVIDNDGGNDAASQFVTVNEPNTAPAADAGPDQTVADTDGQAGEAIALDGSGSSDSDGSIIGYAWTWNGGSANGMDPTVTLPDGTMVVTLTVTDEDGATGSDTVFITVEAPPPPPYVDQYSTGSSTQEGVVSGNHTNTHGDDGLVQSITEQESGGKPSKRRSSLQHQWTFDVSAGTTISLMTNAWVSGPADVDSYTFSYSTDGSVFTELFTVSSTTSDNVQAAALPASLNGTVYVRVVDSDNGQGERVLGQLSVDDLLIRTDNQPVTPPATPTGLSASAPAHNRVELNWTDEATDETAYEVERSNGGAGNWSQMATLSANVAFYSDTSVNAESTYDYRVLAMKGATPSAPSNVASATTLPAPVSSIELSAQGRIQGKKYYVDLSWSGAQGSNVEIWRDGAAIATAANDGAYTDNLSKSASGSYEYEVCETDGSACSDPVLVNL